MCKEYNVYDFDKTIYNSDSTLDFYKHCIKRYPGTLLALPRAIIGVGLYILRLISKTRFKEIFFGYLKYIPDLDKTVSAFWKDNSNKVFTWYTENREENDIIISASPEFLLQPICIQLGIKYLIATKVDVQSGKFDGENCFGEEKVRRFREKFQDSNINEFYSDSLSDLPLARLAKKSYLVEGDKIKEWIIKN